MISTLSLNLEKLTKDIGVRAEVAVRKIALDVQRDLMAATPVHTGLLQSSWFIGVGTEPADKPIKPDGGEAARNRAFQTLAAWKYGDTIWITNNQVYAVSIEFGHSKQAPAGMARLTVARYQAMAGRWGK